MFLLALCAITWLALLGSSVSLWVLLERPLGASDLVILVLVTTAAAAFARLGLISLLGLALRILPRGRVRSWVSALALRWAPRLLGSTILAAVAVTGTAVTGSASDRVRDPSAEAVSATAALDPDRAPDPGWPTIPADPRDPGWPTTGPDDDDRLGDPPPPTDPPDGAEASDGDGTADDADEADDRDGSDSPRTHVVTAGESLWSIAGELIGAGDSQAELVADIYADNRDAIGPDPDLIMPGQRLVIRS
ncbi:LysM domain-containing protein [Brevibacterium sp. Mu109]|uniref:LysM peptidoglycan-binding domain-containing protein n=1 Tax=Brevibacterium sp. Mu109 TaxID=1255669 RepID=UPI000C3A58CE|nr:LysM domain-containing protein [Brevibacterium sp. Mu109]SMY03283.1 LysM domain-containing protein [Brevibacterium sp. Mu109]